MSDFTCRNHHTLKAGEYSCPICGERLTFVDGLSRSEARRQEEMEEEYPEEEDNDEVD